ncbi:universal stress protein [Corynebacterium sp. 3HC-13]|uniref:universal stress protein n=1 Tax=Corynebacterium poyangense TaxID=2684405 RepID=UPI001CCF7B4C|nr:universal stress protein [Corynebacterium poyangense]MBZ8177396.1 universal stress protein [Corynebacterium poyangense]
MSCITVGYTATATGRDALNLGIALARGLDFPLTIAMVEPRDDLFGAPDTHDAGYEKIIHHQLQEWLDDAINQVPKDISAEGVIVRACSDAEGILVAAHQAQEKHHAKTCIIVVGSRSGGLLKRMVIGSTARELLHTADFPVALAPTGYSRQEPVSRITGMFGPRPGAVDVVSIAARIAHHRNIPLRLASLVTEEQAESIDNRVRTMVGELQHDPQVTVELGSGATLEQAITQLSWDDDEILVLGSARIAPRGHLFLGRNAHHIVRHSPVPVVVIPAGTGDDSDGG